MARMSRWGRIEHLQGMNQKLKASYFPMEETCRFESLYDWNFGKVPWNSSDEVMNINSLIPDWFPHTEKCHNFSFLLVPTTTWIHNFEAQVRLKWAAMISMPRTLFKAEKLLKLRWNLPDETWVTSSYCNEVKDLPPDLQNMKDHWSPRWKWHESMGDLDMFTDVARNGKIRLCGWWCDCRSLSNLWAKTRHRSTGTCQRLELCV